MTRTNNKKITLSENEDTSDSNSSSDWLLTWQDYRHIKCENNPFCDYDLLLPHQRHNYIQCRRKKRRSKEIRNKNEDKTMKEIIESLGDKAETHYVNEWEYRSDTEDPECEDLDYDHDIPTTYSERVYMKSTECICYLHNNKFPSVRLNGCGKIMHFACMVSYYYSNCPTKELCPFCRKDWTEPTETGIYYNGLCIIHNGEHYLL